VIRPALALLAFLAVVPLSNASQSELPLVPCSVAGIDARCGRFVVPEDRSQPEGRSISLRVAVVPARDGGSQADPLVHITGGPGGSTIADAAGMASLFAAANAHRDIVLVDQRGTGGSNRLVCPPPAKGTIVDPSRPGTLRAYAQACFAKLNADSRQYTTAPAMDDLAAVLRALGYERVNVYGVSYGATAAQYFLSQHPELVRTAILDGGTLLDVPIFEQWGRNGQRALQAILARCAASTRCARSYPRVRQEVFEVISSLRRAPVRADGRRIDAATFADTIQSLSRSPAGAAEIPWVAHRARVGDWGPFTLALERHLGEASPTRQVMFWSIVCNEPWARWSPARTAAASRGTYLAEQTANEARGSALVCAVIPKARQPEWSFRRVRSQAPVLLVVGGADPQDPLANVAGARRELPNSRTVVVPGAGHGSAQLGCMPRLVNAFVERGTAAGLDTSCVARYVPPPFFAP
jgi:pimeloyl-ACP methyl ester carboxylesterase